MKFHGDRHERAVKRTRERRFPVPSSLIHGNLHVAAAMSALVANAFRGRYRAGRHFTMLIRIGRAADVAEGQMRAFDVAGTRVNISNARGDLYAFDDTCTHAGCSLANGELEGTTVTCACHGSQFDVTSGAVLRGPAQRPVRARRVETEGEDLLVEA